MYSPFLPCSNDRLFCDLFLFEMELLNSNNNYCSSVVVSMCHALPVFLLVLLIWLYPAVDFAQLFSVDN